VVICGTDIPNISLVFVKLYYLAAVKYSYHLKNENIDNVSFLLWSDLDFSVGPEYFKRFY
jgi:hypothetical protein